jgi:hypothetical protein
MPPEYAGQVDGDAKDGEIEMPPEYVGRDAEDEEIEMSPEGGGQAGTDAGVDGKASETPPDDAGQAGADVGEGEIEMPPEYVGQASVDTAGQEPNDAPVLLGAPPPESVEQTDAGDDEIEMPTEYVGQPGLNALEDLKDVPGIVGNAARAVLRDAAHEKDLANYSSYEELAAYYKEISNGLPDNYKIPGDVDHMNKLDLKSREELDTYEELKAATKGLLEQRDKQFDVEDQLEARYGNEFEDHGFGRYLGADLNYRQLADYYENLYKLLYDGAAPDMEGLDTYEKLKIATYETMEQRDNRLELSERYDKEIEDLDTYEKLAEHYKDLHKVVKKDPNSDNYEGRDLKDFEQLDTYQELHYQLKLLMRQHDNQQSHGVRVENVEEVKNDVDDSAEDAADRNYKFFFGTEDVVDSDTDPGGEVIEDAGGTVGDPYGYGDYFGW